MSYTENTTVWIEILTKAKQSKAKQSNVPSTHKCVNLSRCRSRRNSSNELISLWATSNSSNEVKHSMPIKDEILLLQMQSTLSLDRAGDTSGLMSGLATHRATSGSAKVSMKRR